MPTDLQALPPDVQQRRIKWRAVGLMTMGMIVVLIFSDPMVRTGGRGGKASPSTPPVSTHPTPPRPHDCHDSRVYIPPTHTVILNMPTYSPTPPTRAPLTPCPHPPP